MLVFSVASTMLILDKTYTKMVLSNKFRLKYVLHSNVQT